jgi:hypothetical protein
VEEMPDMKQKVAAAMADKYWMDILVRHESHPMVARLVPETPPSALIAIPDLVTELFVARATWRRTPWLISS